jgi:hypothetical protein
MDGAESTLPTMSLTMESFPTAAPVRRARPRWPFAVAAGFWAVIAVSMLLGLVLPKVPGPVLLGLAITAYTFNLYLLVPVLLGGLLAWWGWRTGRRRWSQVAAVLSALLIAGVAVPSWQLWRSAAAYDVSLSVPAYFGGPHGGASAPAATETYATVDGIELKVDVWQPTGAAAGPRPAMIYVFGGGWVSGDRKQMPAYFRWLTSQGLTVFAIDYRLATAGHPVWD